MAYSISEISAALEAALVEHQKPHGGGTNSKQTRDIVKILLWDNRREISAALKIAASLEKRNGR